MNKFKEVSLGVRTNRYTIADPKERQKLIDAGLPADFEAISIGDERGQLCFVPLDESSIDHARVIVNLWNALMSLLPPSLPENPQG